MGGTLCRTLWARTPNGVQGQAVVFPPSPLSPTGPSHTLPLGGLGGNLHRQAWPLNSKLGVLIPLHTDIPLCGILCTSRTPLLRSPQLTRSTKPYCCPLVTSGVSLYKIWTFVWQGKRLEAKGLPLVLTNKSRILYSWGYDITVLVRLFWLPLSFGLDLLFSLYFLGFWAVYLVTFFIVKNSRFSHFYLRKLEWF
jgi:hypothetical protein